MCNLSIKWKLNHIITLTWWSPIYLLTWNHQNLTCQYYGNLCTRPQSLAIFICYLALKRNFILSSRFLLVNVRNQRSPWQWGVKPRSSVTNLHWPRVPSGFRPQMVMKQCCGSFICIGQLQYSFRKLFHKYVSEVFYAENGLLWFKTYPKEYSYIISKLWISTKAARSETENKRRNYAFVDYIVILLLQLF